MALSAKRLQLALPILLLILAFSVLVAPCLGQISQVLVALTPSEICSVSIGEAKASSFRFEIIGGDLQVYFSAYNVTDNIWDIGILKANITVTDPRNQYTLMWSELTDDGRAIFLVSSVRGVVTTVVSRFVGMAIAWGKPPMTYLKVVGIGPSVPHDIYLGGQRFCGFDWIFIVFENKTIPQLRIYNLDGTLKHNPLATASLVTLAEFGGSDGVGFMMKEIIYPSKVVKWLLYSGKDIVVRPSTGFAPLALPFMTISANQIEPDQPVTIRFTLPEGVTRFTHNLKDMPVTEPFQTLTKEGEYSLTFKFYSVDAKGESTKGRQYTIIVRCDKYGTIYQSDVRILVLPYWYEPFLGPIAFFSVLIFGAFLFIRWVRGRMGPPSPETAWELGK